MKSLEEHLNHLHIVRLPEKVRSRMRAELSSFADLHAAHAAVFSARSASSLVRAFHVRLYTGLAAILLLVLGIGGTAYASGRALPGDALYPIKVGVAEPIQTALIPSASGKATWHAILAERRLEEASQLAARGDLAANVQDTLAAQFSTEVDASLDSADEVQQEGHPIEALSVRSDLEARVAAHGRILDVLAAHYATATSTDAVATASSIQTLRAVVALHQQKLEEGRLALEDAITPGEGAPEETATVAMSADAAPHGKRPAAMMQHGDTPRMQVAEARFERTNEVEAILSRHASLLAKFLPLPATTTATTTVEETATSTPEDGSSDSRDEMK